MSYLSVQNEWKAKIEGAGGLVHPKIKKGTFLLAAKYIFTLFICTVFTLIIMMNK